MAESTPTPTSAEIEAVKVLIAHQRLDISSCICGWGVDTGDLGRNHSLHVWRELQRAVLPDPHPGCPKHAPGQRCQCGMPDRCTSYTHDPAYQPYTPEAPSGAQGLILGRAWLDADGDIWQWLTREEADAYAWLVRPVLLVDPAAGPVLEAALEVVAHDRMDAAFYASIQRLAAAVDALTATTGMTKSSGHDQLAPAGVPDSVSRWDDTTTGGPDHDGLTGAPLRHTHACVMVADHTEHACGCGHTWLSGWDDPGTAPVWTGTCDAKPPAGDGPGWDQEAITELIQLARADATSDDQLNTTHSASLRELAEVTAERDQAVADRDATGRLNGALIAKLAEVEAERDRYRQHSTTLNTIAWRVATALGDVPDGGEQIEGNPLEQVERLIAERDRLRTGAMVVGVLLTDKERLTREQAATRRDGAADALEDAARRIRRVFAESGMEIARYVAALAATTRAGEREVPTSVGDQDGDGDG